MWRGGKAWILDSGAKSGKRSRKHQPIHQKPLHKEMAVKRNIKCITFLFFYKKKRKWVIDSMDYQEENELWPKRYAILQFTQKFYWYHLIECNHSTSYAVNIILSLCRLRNCNSDFKIFPKRESQTSSHLNILYCSHNTTSTSVASINWPYAL